MLVKPDWKMASMDYETYQAVLEFDKVLRDEETWDFLIADENPQLIRVWWAQFREDLLLAWTRGIQRDDAVLVNAVSFVMDMAAQVVLDEDWSNPILVKSLVEAGCELLEMAV